MDTCLYVHSRLTVLKLSSHTVSPRDCSQPMFYDECAIYFSPLTPPNEVIATENVSEHPSPSNKGADGDTCDIDPLFPGGDENLRREVRINCTHTAKLRSKMHGNLKNNAPCRRLRKTTRVPIWSQIWSRRKRGDSRTPRPAP